jgi:ligand-binding sensor domain-containing protein/signal transduction histidine kinase
MSPLVKILYLICWMLLLFSVAANAQHPHFWQLTEDDGLPSNVVYDLKEGRKGYVWIGTDKGLVKYNGQRFQMYATNAQKSLAVTNLREDKNGRIWCSNFSHQLFYVEGDSLREIPIPSCLGSEPVFGHIKTAIIGDYLYVFAYNFVDRYHLDSRKWEADFYAKDWPKNHKTFTRRALNGVVGTESLLYMCFKYEVHYNSKGEEKQVIQIANPDHHFLHELIGDSLFLFSRNELSTDKLMPGLDGLFPVTMNPAFTDTSARILNVATTSDDRFWVCTTNGVAQLKASSSVADAAALFFPDQQVSDVLLDREGNLWVSTLQSAIYIIPGSKITTYNSHNSTLISDHIRSLGKDNNGNLLLGTFYGDVQTIDTSGVGNPIRTGIKKEVNGFVTFDNGEVGAYGDYLFSLTNVGKRIWHDHSYFKKIRKLYSNVFAVLRSHQLILVEDKVGEAKVPDRNLYPELWSSGKLSSNRLYLDVANVRSFVSDTIRRHLYVSTISGLFRISEEEKVELTTRDGKSSHGLQIELATDGILWVATASQGILGFKDTVLVHQFGQSTGLKTNYFSNLIIEEETIWAASSVGLYRINISTGKFELFDRLDGLPSNEINDMLLLGDNVWLATMKGVVKIDKAHTSINSIAPGIELSNTYVNQQRKAEISELKYHQNNVAFELSSIAFRNQGSGYIRYRLVGHSNQWVNVPLNENKINFQALPPGEYTFQAFVVNEDGIESEKRIQHTFTILPPFWQTWWFYTLAVILLIVLVSALFFVRIYLLKKRNKIQHDLRVSELVALKAQMNPHFIFNALNSIQEYVLLHKTELANDYLGKFARLMRKTLDLSNQMDIALEEEVDLLELYLELEAIRFEDSFSYQITLEEGLKESNGRIPSMVIQPFVENAIKHGLLHKKDNRELTVSFRVANNVLHCDVIDNGIGITASTAINAKRNQTHKSFGTSAIRKRLALLNEERNENITVEMIDLFDDNGMAAGTHVKLAIPFIKKQKNA